MATYIPQIRIILWVRLIRDDLIGMILAAGVCHKGMYKYNMIGMMLAAGVCLVGGGSPYR